MRDDPDVLVVGGGVVGLFCAYHLRRTGASVAVVERGAVGGPQSCSSGTTGFVGTHGAGVPVLLDVKKDSLAILRELCASGPLAATFTAPGMIIAYRTAEGLEDARRTLPALVARGIPMRVLDAGELSALEPGLEFDVRGATFNEEGAYLRVPEFLRELATVLAGLGVEIHPHTEALGVEVCGGSVRQVRTTRGDLRPAELVLAAGVWSTELAAALGLRLPLHAVKGHAVTVRAAPHSAPQDAAPQGPAPHGPAPHGPVPQWPAPRRPVTLGEAVVAIAPTSDGVRIGGVRELAGLDTAVSRRQVNGMLRTVRDYLPGLRGATPTGFWTGLRPTTPDGVPFIGRVQRCRNVSIASGHGHIGMGLAPAGGRLLAQLIAGKPPDIDPTPFRVDRFDRSS